MDIVRKQSIKVDFKYFDFTFESIEEAEAFALTLLKTNQERVDSVEINAKIIYEKVGDEDEV